MTTPTVPGYEDLEKIGSGGFASVYKATQTAVGRHVALKLLHHAIADEDTERRFQRECRVVGSLSWHPHIAAVLDAGADDEGRSYLAFELLTGGSLGDRLKKSGPIDWPEAVTFAIETADALAAAHEQEVLHRDVKPDNILIDRLGRSKLADFGIAQMHDGNQTKSGVITATLAHAAPEVLNGHRATKLSDVYLLGSTLFELIVGEPPFGKMLGNDFFGAIQRIATEPAPRLADSPGISVPTELSQLVERALQKEPEARFDSAAAFGQELRDLQRGAGLPMTPMPFVEAKSAASQPATPVALEQAFVEDPAPSNSPAHLPLAQDPAPSNSPAQLPLAETPVPISPSESPAHLPLAETPVPISRSESPAHLPLAQDPAPGAPSESPASPSIADSAVWPVPAASPTTTSPPSPPQSGPQQIGLDAIIQKPNQPKSKLPLVAAGVVVAVLAIGGAWLATRGDTADEPANEIVPIEALQTDSQQGQNSANAIDGDLATGWLSPDNPNGHEIIIGFGKQVMLESIVVHSGPDPSGGGTLGESRSLGPAVLEFSDGTETTVEFDQSTSVQTINVGRTTSSLGIRTLSNGEQPVAIREIEFVGRPQP